MTRVPLSVLDLAPVWEGGTGAEALQASLGRARLVERLGFRRIWFAEHHLAPGVASSAPGVLAALAAGVTSTLRVGSAAVLLGSTSPVVAAEQFGTIAAAYPGRVDLGLGRASFPPPSKGGDDTATVVPERAPGATEDRVVDGLLVPANPPFTFRDPDLLARFVAQQRYLGAARTPAAFTDELRTVLDLLEGIARSDDGRDAVSPAVQDADLDLWVLASSAGESARVAGELGLPLAANYHVSPSTVLETVAAYRAAFRPGVLTEPYVVVSADVLVAETDERAHELADPFAAWVLSIRSGARAIPYPRPGTTTPWEQRSDDERALLRDRIVSRLVGDASQVAAGLDALVRATGADELLLTTITHDPADTARSYELLAREWGLAGAGELVGAGASAAHS
ncbi:LLM class flavin-dependent oxidoreductase [Cellulomonas sp. URHE0023]|uniref:LLM class flavin-dependent oxidoreductase n=1 Tax=Cellulomonas sp. URHE0023 TaxID=1380354 RepID=UPI00069132B4|nr:LLM class flavin-dependent oxidoreductase [Cellulomonas sp. URHE0023]